MTDATTTDAPREAVRPATECWLVHDGHWFATSMLRADEIVPGDGDVLALAIDNATGGGLVARVRADFDKIAWDDIEATYHEMGHDKFVQKMTERVCKALGVTP